MASKASGWTEQLKTFCRRINEEALGLMDGHDASKYPEAGRLLEQQIQTLD